MVVKRKDSQIQCKHQKTQDKLRLAQTLHNATI